MNVKIARIKKKMKIQELADLVGISREYLRRIENETANPTRSVMEKLSKVLEASVQELFF